MGRGQKRSGRGKPPGRRRSERHEGKQQGRGKGGGGSHRSGGKSQGRVLVGKIQKNPKGFAFVIPKDRTQKDAYVAREDARLLLNDDIVEYVVHREGFRYNAEIKRIVERGQTQVLGQLRLTQRGMVFETPGGEYFDVRHAPKAINHWAIAEIVEFPSRRDGAVVEIREDLGTKLNPNDDYKIAIAEFGLEDVFPEQALRNAENMRKAGEQEFNEPASDRKDLREVPFVTIDGEDAKDFDDAIYVREEKGGGYTLFVAIADVSFYVRWGSALDKSARGRATSVYFPGFCLPMLPEILSNDLCSLRPREDKLALVAEISYDRQGKVQESTFYEAIIKTAERLTYTRVHAYFEKDPTERKALHALAKPLESAFALFQKLDRQRKERGVLDFDLGEASMQLGKDGIPSRIFRAPRFESHRLIEEFMIAANSAVAKVLREQKARSLYRVHDAPEPDRIDEINQLMKTLGIPERLEEVSPKAFARVLEATHGVKGAKTLHQNILRSQKQARYEPDPRGHFGLALRDYTHFTSPIRRYPDLVVHRALKQFILDAQSADKDEDRVNYDELGEITSDRERRAMEAERFVTRRKQCWFMEGHVGESFKGIINGITEKGLFVEIPEFAIDGFIAVDTMPGHYHYDENSLCLRKRPGHTTLNIGDELPIRVEAVSVLDNQITFAYVEE